MTKRAYSPKEIEAKRYDCLPWGDRWSAPFGYPPINETWFIEGSSASGKSSFVMQLGKELCKYGKVLYASYEEGVSQSFKERIEREKMSEVQGRFIVAVDDSYEELVERLQKRKSPTFVIIDSFQEAYWSYEQARELITSFPRKSFIFISQEDKGQPMGKPAKRLRYKAGIKVRVSGFKAYCRGRYTGDPGSYYVVWEEGVMRTTNNVV